MRKVPDLADRGRQECINLTYKDARLMKSSQSIVPGYNAQAMASPSEPDAGARGMLVTAVDVVDDRCSSSPRRLRGQGAGDVGGRRLPLRDRAGRMRPERPAGGGAGPTTKASSAATVSQGPFHLRRGQRLLLLPSGTDPQLRQEQAQKRDDNTDVPCLWVRLPRVSGLRSLYEGRHLWSWLGGRASRRSAAPSSRLDGDRGSQTSLWPEKAVGRTGLRNRQRATGCSTVPVAWPCQREGRVDGAGYRLQPTHPLEGVAFPGLPFHLSTPRPRASPCSLTATAVTTATLTPNPALP